VRTRSCLVSLALALSFGAASATAQQRQITGRVTAATTGDAVVGASVAVVGTAIVAATGNDGRFAVAAPEGDVTLVVRRIGFKRKSVPVPAAQGSVEVTLDPDVFNLEAVVVTGQATGVERRTAPNAVATVSANELSRVPAPSVETSIQGKVPGAVIQQNSGAPGGGIQVKLRGVSTLNGLSAPLYVVDGVIMSDAAIPNNQEVVTLSNQGSNPSPLQQNQVNRIADLSCPRRRAAYPSGPTAASSTATATPGNPIAWLCTSSVTAATSSSTGSRARPASTGSPTGTRNVPRSSGSRLRSCNRAPNSSTSAAV